MNISEVKIGQRIESTNGRYYHIVQSIGKKKDLGMGDQTIPVKTKCFSQTGRFVQNEKICFNKNSNNEFVAGHIN